MCPFGDPDKQSQIKNAKKNDLSTDQWKEIFQKVSEYCIWSIIEGGEPTSRPDFMELVQHLYNLKMPITLITNCSLLHEINLQQLKKYVQFITCSIDSVFEEPYCKVRGVTPKIFWKVMKNLHLLIEYDIPHYFNSVITKYNAEEFIDQTYFDKAKELGSNAVSLTFVEDRSDVNYSLLPDRRTITKVCESILGYTRNHASPQIMIPPEALLSFHLATPVTVTPVSYQEAQRLQASVAQQQPRLQHRTGFAYPYPYPYAYPYPYYGYAYPYPYPYVYRPGYYYYPRY